MSYVARQSPDSKFHTLEFLESILLGVNISAEGLCVKETGVPGENTWQSLVDEGIVLNSFSVNERQPLVVSLFFLVYLCKALQRDLQKYVKSVGCVYVCLVWCLVCVHVCVSEGV